MNKETFLNKVCNEIKYQSIHKYVRNELTEYIHDAAAEFKDYGQEIAESCVIRELKNPKELGQIINNQYKMPFNNKYGITILFGIIVTFIYFIMYPLSCSLTNGLLVFLLYAVLMLANVAVLKRSHLNMSGRDIRDVSLGFLIGTVFSLAVLFALSLLSKFGYYYNMNIKIPLCETVSYQGVSFRFCGDELLIYIFCIMTYTISLLKIKSQNFFKMSAPYPHIPNSDSAGKVKVGSKDLWLK